GRRYFRRGKEAHPCGEPQAAPRADLQSERSTPVNGRIIDVIINLSRWPLRRVRDDETANLVARLRSHGVVEAWAGSFDGLLHKAPAAVTTRLARECRAQAGVRLVPFGSVNPLLPDWEEDLRRCAEEHHMPGIRRPCMFFLDPTRPSFTSCRRFSSSR